MAWSLEQSYSLRGATITETMDNAPSILLSGPGIVIARVISKILSFLNDITLICSLKGL